MNRLVLKRFVLVALIISLVGAAEAQLPDPITEMSLTLTQVDALLDSSKTEIVVNDATTLSIEQVEGEEIEQWTQAQKEYYYSLSGWRLQAGYDRKYGNGSDDIYDDFYSYKNRFNAMLSWNILESGLLGRKANDQLVELESQKLLLDEYSNLNAEQIRVHAQHYQQVLDSYRNNIYSTKIEIYESLTKLLKALHSQGQATTVEISQVEMELHIAQGAIGQTDINMEGLFNLQDYIASQVMIDPQMVESLTQSSATVEQSKLNESILNHQASEVSYWDDASISPFAKVQHYSDSGFTTSRMTANIGVTASFPLFSGTKNKRAEIQARSALAAKTTSAATTSVSLQINQSATELNRNLERLNATVKLEELYKAQIKTAKEAYQHKQLTMQELTQYYLRLLSLQSSAIEIIGDRESLKAKLLLTTL